MKGVDVALKRANTDEALCEGAFDAAMEQFAIKAPARLAVAVSGGADSMALALLLARWASGKHVELHALTVDHRLRDEAAAEAKQVGLWLKAHGIAHTTLSWDEGVKLRGIERSPQQAAREARYGLMIDWCAQNECTHLLVAHHADDQVETFLMRLTRGSGVDGLAAMPSATQRGTVTIARPLLEFSKAQLEEFCRSQKQAWLEDPSNRNEASTRIRFRKAQDVLEREGLTRHRLLATVRHMRRAKAALDQGVTSFLKASCALDSYGVIRIDVKDLAQVPEEIGLRALGRILMTVSGSIYGPRFENLESLYVRMTGGPWSDTTLHGCQLVRDGQRMLIMREAAHADDVRPISPGRAVLWDGRFRIGIELADTLTHSGPYRIGRLTAADWRDFETGDEILESTLPLQRALEGLPGIYDEAGLAAVPHFGAVRKDLKNILSARVESAAFFPGSPPKTGAEAKMLHPS